MGYVRNHALIVTACYGDYIERAHTKASLIFPWVSPVSPPDVNGTQSFFVPPDGSKEGWEESDIGDERRKQFKAWLKSQVFGDGSTPISWAEVRYGGDDNEASIEDSCHPSWRSIKPPSAASPP